MTLRNKRTTAITIILSFFLVTMNAGASISSPVNTSKVFHQKKTHKINVNDINDRKVHKGKKTKIKAPKVVTSKNIRVIDRTISVSRSGRTLAKRKKAVNLKAGSYTVATHVKHRVKTNGKWGKVKVSTKKQRVNVKTMTTKESNKLIAKKLIKNKYNWGKSQYKCLVKLWEKESGWNHKAKNRYSGAYGIPQSYPGNKMRSAGSDWRTNPKTQIKWGASYIKGRYGTPCKAWAHSKSRGWY